MNILEQVGIAESEDPNAFPSPRQWVQSRAAYGEVDLKQEAKTYASEWEKQQKAYGDVPSHVIAQGKGLIQNQLFGRAFDAQDFLENYNTYINPVADDPAAADAEKKEAEPGAIESTGRGLAQGAGAATGGTLIGLDRDISNALSSKFGTVVDPQNIDSGITSVFGAGEALGRRLFGIEDSNAPDAYQILAPETVKTMIQFGGPDVLYGDTDLVKLGTAIEEATKSDIQIDNNWFKSGNAVGSAIPTLATAGAGLTVGLGRLAIAATSVTQSAGQLANEQVDDYMAVIGDPSRGDNAIDPDDLANATFLGAALSTADLLPIGKLLNNAGVKNLVGLDKVLNGAVARALLSKVNPDNRLVKAMGGAATEAGAEVLQKLGSNWIAEGLIEYDEGRNYFEGTAEAAEGGAIAGFVINLLLARGARRGSDPAQEQPETPTGAPSPNNDFTGSGETGQIDLVNDPMAALDIEAAGQEVQKLAAILNTAIETRGTPEAAEAAEVLAPDLANLTAEVAKAQAAATRNDQLVKTIAAREAAGATEAQLTPLRREQLKTEKAAQELESLQSQQTVIEAQVSQGRSGFNVVPIDNPYAKQMAAVEQKYGLPVGTASVIAQIESNFDTNVKNPNSSATGLYQFIDSTARSYGLLKGKVDNRKNATASIDAFGRLARDNMKGLQAAGIQVTPFTIYMGHQQGLTGFTNLVSAAQTGKVTAEQREHMDLNGGVGLNAAQFLDKWKATFEKKANTTAQFTLPTKSVAEQPVKPADSKFTSAGPARAQFIGATLNAPASAPTTTPAAAPEAEDTFTATHTLEDGTALIANPDQADTFLTEEGDVFDPTQDEGTVTPISDVTTITPQVGRSNAADAAAAISPANKTPKIPATPAPTEPEAVTPATVTPVAPVTPEPTTLDTPVADNVADFDLPALNASRAKDELLDESFFETGFAFLEEGDIVVKTRGGKGAPYKRQPDLKTIRDTWGAYVANGSKLDGLSPLEKAIVGSLADARAKFSEVDEAEVYDQDGNFSEGIIDRFPDFVVEPEPVVEEPAKSPEQEAAAVADVIEIGATLQDTNTGDTLTVTDIDEDSKGAAKAVRLAPSDPIRPPAWTNLARGLTEGNLTPVTLNETSEAAPVVEAEPETTDFSVDNYDLGLEVQDSILNAYAADVPPKNKAALRRRIKADLQKNGFTPADANEELADIEALGVFDAAFPEETATEDANAALQEAAVASGAQANAQAVADIVAEIKRTRNGLRSRPVRRPINQTQLTSVLDKTLGQGNYTIGLPPGVQSTTTGGSFVAAVTYEGKIYFNPDQISTRTEAEFYAMQEQAHVGIQKLFGAEYNNRLTALYTAMGQEAGISRFARANDIDLSGYFNLANAEPNGDRGPMLVDELVAHLATRSDKLSIRARRAFNGWVGAVRNAFRKRGFLRLAAVNESDLVYLAKLASRAGRNPNQDHFAENMSGSAPAQNARPRFPARFGLKTPQEQIDLERANSEFLSDPKRNKTLKDRLDSLDGRAARSLSSLRDTADNYLFNGETTLRSRAAKVIKRNFTSSGNLAPEFANAKRRLGANMESAKYVMADEIARLDETIRRVMGVPSGKLTPAQQDYVSGLISGNNTLASEEGRDAVEYFRARVDRASTDLVNHINVGLDARIQMLDNEGKLALAQLRREYDAGVLDWVPGDIPPHLEVPMMLYARRETVMANRGTYLTRAYAAFTDPNWTENIRGTDKYNDAVDFIENDMRDTFTKRIKARDNAIATDEDIRQLAVAEVNGILDTAHKAKSPIAFATSGATNASLLKRRKEGLPVEIRELLGEIKDPTFNFANSMFRIYSYIHTQQYQRHMRDTILATGQGSLSKGHRSAEHVRQFPQGTPWDELSDVWVSPEFYNELQTLDAVQPLNDSWIENMIKVSQFVKFGKTVLSPATASRNIMSGVFLLGAMGYSPFNGGADAFVTMWKGQSRGKFVSDLDARRTNENYIRLGIRRDGGTSGELKAILDDIAKTGELLERGQHESTFNWAKEMAIKAYQFGDDYYKIIGFEREKQSLVAAGYSPEQAEAEAAQRVREGMPTYSMVPTAIQKLRRFPLVGTFVSFPWEVMRNGGNNMRTIARDWQGVERNGAPSATGPRKQLAMRKAAGLSVTHALPSLLLVPLINALAGATDVEDELLDATGPAWAKGALRMYLPREEGKGLQHIDLTPFLPSESIARGVRQAMAPAYSDKSMWEGMTSGAGTLLAPFLGWDITLQTVIDVARNSNSDGQPIMGRGVTWSKAIADPETYDSAWDAAILYVARNAGPGFLRNLEEMARVNASSLADGPLLTETEVFNGAAGTALGGPMTRSGRVYSGIGAALGFIGIRAQESNMEQAAFYASRSAQIQLGNFSSGFRRQIDQPTQTTQTNVEDDVNDLLTKRKAAYTLVKKMVDYHKSKGMRPQEIVALMNGGKGAGGLSKDNLEAVIRGRMPVYSFSADTAINGTLRAIDTSPLDPQQKLQAKRGAGQKLRLYEDELKRQARGLSF